MATLLDTSIGRQHVIKAHHVFGRSAQHADSVLTSPSVSLIHASVQWHAQTWSLIDQSRNGSFLNGKRLAKDEPAALQPGDDIHFGDLSVSAWRVADVSPPVDLLMPLSLCQSVIKLAPFQNFPDDTSPEVCLYRSSSGQWCKETRDGVTALNSGEIVYIGAHAWRFVCAEECSGTAVPSNLMTCMKFQSSLDEEHVCLTVQRGGTSVPMGERSHHYLLMLLARQRVADAERGLDSHAQGWVEFDRLVQMLDMEKSHLNIQIFRLRKKFGQLVLKEILQPDFIERRRGELRLSNVALEIRKGSDLEGTWHPGLPIRVAARAN